jgi:ubiquinone/menaquinone biosynthesis C-methylase UbiE
MKDNDKILEKNRYSKRSRLNLIERPAQKKEYYGINNMAEYLAEPYLLYQELISNYVNPTSVVLELGSGEGRHTKAILQTGAKLIACDISHESLIILEKNLVNIGDLQVVVCDMEYLPFRSQSFDVICSAGSLSYGDKHLVDTEIKRLLKREGVFIAVDSLNHNPIYRLNRWFHYIRNNRSGGTLRNMPTVTRIDSLSGFFKTSNVYYFGSITFMMPILSLILGEGLSAKLSRSIDKLVSVRKSAFKFVICLRGAEK